MRLADFDFELPEELIALRPAKPRDASRLLVSRPDGGIEDRRVSELAELLNPGDVLVFNDSRVIAARLSGERRRDDTNIRVEATLHKRLSPFHWTAFMKPGKRLRPGDRIHFGGGEGVCLLGGLDATLEAKGEDGEVTLAFDLSGSVLDEAISATGMMPLPPYIAARRAEDAQDLTDYQTVYAREDGSVAAPTAELHFTSELMARLADRGVQHRYVTLHVGAGTFLPVKADDVADHKMHAEAGEVSAETAVALNTARAAGGRVVCVGTTSLRLLESATGEDGVIRPFSGETRIFIIPGRQIRSADVLMTNFHLPRSTLMMLVAAFAGVERTKAVYAHAIAEGYRFYSYGDSSLWFR